MRTTKLITAAIAAGALMAPAMASAARLHPISHRHQSGIGGCVVSEVAEPRIITSGESAQIYGRLACGGVAETGQTVTVYQRSASATGFTALPATTTGAGGFYQVTASKLLTDSTFYAVAAGARSANRVVRVSPIVTVIGPGETTTSHPESKVLLTGQHNAVTFIGTVSPADQGAIITLQREAATGFEEWKGIQNGVVGFGGTYAIRHRFVVPGDANLRILVRRHGKFSVRGISNTLSYEIVQTQNPNLTLNTSANPISEGQSVTLTGKVAGASNAAVTLFGHTAASPWAVVGAGKTNASGEYTFTQSPASNTFYKVQSGAVSSAVLFEGVKYVLAVKASGTTVQAGQPLTFSGTVNPGKAGKVVYLERQNAIGTGFHVVFVGAVTSTGTYSITDNLFGTGNAVLRIKVPGDPTNQAVSSSLFTVNVTAAPPGPPVTITPVLPHEGRL
jgi:hypothetical protein